MKPIAAVITDTHLKEDNIELVKYIFDQVIEYCKDNDIHNIIHGGDVFTSRKGQPQNVLLTWHKILCKAKNHDIDLHVIPGNHDSLDTSQEESFLDVFSYQKLCSDYGTNIKTDYVNVNFHLLPFFDNEQYLERLEKIKTELPNDKINILITHAAINGVKNNDGSIVQKGINSDNFKDFDKVLCGHYHNQQTVGSNIYYIGSAYQANFGEDNQKGLTVIYEDGSHEFVKLSFPEYITWNYDAKDLNDELKTIINSADDENYYRIKVSGSVNKVSKSVKKKLEEHGIKVEAVGDDEVLDAEELEVGKSFTDQDILDSFNEWGEEREVGDIEYGKEKLEKHLNL